MREYCHRAAFGLVAFLVTCGTLWAAPTLEVDKTEWKMGKVPRNETRSNTFTLRNTGDEALEITQIRPSCKSCVGKIDGDKTIKAGESRQLEVTYKAVDAFGDHTMSVTVHSNDPVNPLVRLRLFVTVVPQKDKPALIVTPMSVDVGVVPGGNPTIVNVTLANEGDAPLNLLSIVASAGCQVIGDFKDAIAAGRNVVIPVQVTPRAKGVIQESIAFETNDPERPNVEVRIEGYAQSVAFEAAKGVQIVPVVVREPGKPLQYLFSLANASIWTVMVWFGEAAGADEAVTLEPGAGFEKSVSAPDGGPAPLVLRLEFKAVAPGAGSEP